jgi:hypothetical protein
MLVAAGSEVKEGRIGDTRGRRLAILHLIYEGWWGRFKPSAVGLQLLASWFAES